MGSIPQISVLRGEAYPCDPVKYIHKLFNENATNFSNKLAVIFKDVQTNINYQLTFEELESASNRLARAIIKEILKQNGQANSDGDWVIAVSLAPSHILVTTLLAIWKAGAAYLPIDKCSPPSRVKHIVSEAKPTLIITEETNNNDEERDGFNIKNMICFQHLNNLAMEESDAKIEESEMLHTENKKVAIVLYTSGSTGVPKGVRVLHSSILNRLNWQWREFPYESDEHICVFKTALTFVDAVSEIWGPLLAKEPKTVLVVPRQITKDPERLINLLEEYKVKRLVLVPSLLRAMLMYLKLYGSKNQPMLLSSLKLWVCSGETLSKSLVIEFLQHFECTKHILCNFYGSTEVMGDVTFYKIQSLSDLDSFEDKVPIGIPLDNTMVYLLDKHQKPVSLGKIGEIYASGLNIAAGYVNGRDPDRFINNSLTKEPDHSMLYRTGDFGRVVKNTIVYEGRTDSQIKVRGHRVDLAEIDGVLNKLNGINKSVVLCYKPGEIDQAVISYVTLNAECSLSSGEIEDLLMKHLPSYSVPQVHIIDTIPLLINGKVDRQRLLKQHEELSCNENTDEMDYSSVPENKTAAAKILLKTVSSVLKSSLRGKISLDSNFYQLGGNSLNSVYTITRLKDLGYAIGITDFVSAANLGQVLEKMTPENELNSVIKYTESQVPFSSEIMSDRHKTYVYRIITDSFYEKADLERWIVPRIVHNDYHELLDKLWDALVKAQLSFVVKRSDKVIGVSLNFDVHDEPEVTLESKMQIVFDFLEYMESSVREQYLPKEKGLVLHSFMMGTDQSLNPAENVSIMQFMEEEGIQLAKSRGFTSIFTTNSSPLTQQLGTDIFGYKVLKEYRVNQYIASDGSKPFGCAPDSQTVSVSWKLLNE